MKFKSAVEIFLGFLYLIAPFGAGIIFNLISTKIAEKFVGRKIFYNEDFSAKIISYLSLAVFAIVGYYFYVPIFYKIYNYAANFDRETFIKFVAISTFIVTFILLFIVHEKFFKESDNLPQIVLKIYFYVALVISAVVAFIVAILLHEFIF